MKLLKQTRFEQVPIALALKVAKEEARLTTIKRAQKPEKQTARGK